jgi:phosphonatase-like hydrolase
MVRLVAFDVAGTTVGDSGLVLKAFENAFSKVVPELWATKEGSLTRYAIDTMGQSKIEVFTYLLRDAELAHEANFEFEEAYKNIIVREGIEEIPGARTLFELLRSRGIKVALTTGFSRSTIDLIIHTLGWRELIDASAVPSEVGQGRPNPAMLQAVARKLQLRPNDVVVVGDTASDMQAGTAFGALKSVGVLTGAHDVQQLLDAGASEVIPSISSLPNYLFNLS